MQEEMVDGYADIKHTREEKSGTSESDIINFFAGKMWLPAPGTCQSLKIKNCESESRIRKCKIEFWTFFCRLQRLHHGSNWVPRRRLALQAPLLLPGHWQTLPPDPWKEGIVARGETGGHQGTVLYQRHQNQGSARQIGAYPGRHSRNRWMSNTWDLLRYKGHLRIQYLSDIVVVLFGDLFKIGLAGLLHCTLLSELQYLITSVSMKTPTFWRRPGRVWRGQGGPEARRQRRAALRGHRPVRQLSCWS